MTDPTPTDREALATLIDEADNRWQHGIGAGGYDPNGLPLWIADAILASDWLREVKGAAWDECFNALSMRKAKGLSGDLSPIRNPYRDKSDD